MRARVGGASISTLVYHFFLFCETQARRFQKTKPARIHSPDPFLRAGNEVSVLPNPNPQKIVWQNRVRIEAPRTARILGGQNPKEKCLFHFQEKFHPRQIRNARSVFSFGVAGVLASAWGFLRIICFESRFELGTINTQERPRTHGLYVCLRLVNFVLELNVIICVALLDISEKKKHTQFS